MLFLSVTCGKRTVLKMEATTLDQELIDLITSTVNTTLDAHVSGDRAVTRSQQNEQNFSELVDNFRPLIIATTSALLLGMRKHDQQRDADHNALKDKCQEKVLNQTLLMDKMDATIRQDNVILIGQKEPASNYERYGRESENDLEGYLIDAAGKVGITIKPEEISFAYRIGSGHKEKNQAPKRRSNGENVARPILFRFAKRAKRVELLKAKKKLREDHGIKITEDATPLRKALCDFVNKLDEVKVAYHQDGKVCVRLKSDDSKVIMLESYKDLDKIGHTGDHDWEALNLADQIL